MVVYKFTIYEHLFNFMISVHKLVYSWIDRLPVRPFLGTLVRFYPHAQVQYAQSLWKPLSLSTHLCVGATVTGIAYCILCKLWSASSMCLSRHLEDVLLSFHTALTLAMPSDSTHC